MLSIHKIAPLLLLFPNGSAAQATLDSVAHFLMHGQILRIHFQDRMRLEGMFVGYTPESQTFQLRIGDSVASLTEIDSLWVRTRATGTGAIAGSVVVGVASALFWSGVCEGLGDTPGCDNWTAVAALTAAGAAVGALLGAGIGSAISRWRLLYAPQVVGLRAVRLSRQQLGFGIHIPFSTRIR